MLSAPPSPPQPEFFQFSLTTENPPLLPPHVEGVSHFPYPLKSVHGHHISRLGSRIIHTHPLFFYSSLDTTSPCLETGSWARWTSSLLQDSHSWDVEINPCPVPSSLECGATSLQATALFTCILPSYIHYSKAVKALNHAVLSQYTFFFPRCLCESPASLFLIQN